MVGEEAIQLASPVFSLGRNVAAVSFPPSYAQLDHQPYDYYNLGKRYEWIYVQPGLDGTSAPPLRGSHVILNLACLKDLNLTSHMQNPSITDGAWCGEVAQRTQASHWDNVYISDRLVIDVNYLSLTQQADLYYKEVWRMA